MCLSSFLLFVAENVFLLNILLRINDVVTLEDERRQTKNEQSRVPSEILKSVRTTRAKEREINK